MRLTRRGRLCVLLVVLVALLAATVVVGSSVLATSGAGEPVAVRTVTVAPGTTLWELAVAETDDTGGDPRDVVHEIEQLNDLDGAELQIGQRLEVPVSG